ncbi:hypothetical protein ACE1SV_39410 [Streptomyces sp. E-15]
MPHGVVPSEIQPISPGIGGFPAPGTVRGAPDSAEAVRPGDVRRRDAVRPDGNLANSCVFCEGWSEVCPIRFRDLVAGVYGRDQVLPFGERAAGTPGGKIDCPGSGPCRRDGDRLSVGRPRLGER